MAVSSTRDDWLRLYHPAPEAGHQLVCLPHAGGSASFYLPVSQALTPAVEVSAVQYPGRQDRRRDPFINNVPELADRITEAILPAIDRPLALFGHSMGATLSFEVARRLQAASITLSTLFVSGRRGPSTHRNEPGYHRYTDLGLIAELKKLEGTDTMLLDDEDAVQMILPAIRNDYEVVQTYRYVPGPPLTCPIVTLIGNTDGKVTTAEAESWRQETTGPFELQVFTGGHFYLVDQARPVLDTISRQLNGQEFA